MLLGADPEARWSGASSALQVRDCCSSALVEKQKERVCVCKNVNVQEAQSEAFLFIVTVCRVRKSPADTHRHTRTLLCILTAELLEMNTCICKQAVSDTDHPSSGEVFALIFLFSLILFFTHRYSFNFTTNLAG